MSFWHYQCITTVVFLLSSSLHCPRLPSNKSFSFIFLNQKFLYCHWHGVWVCVLERSISIGEIRQPFVVVFTWCACIWMLLPGLRYVSGIHAAATVGCWLKKGVGPIQNNNKNWNFATKKLMPTTPLPGWLTVCQWHWHCPPGMDFVLLWKENWKIFPRSELEKKENFDFTDPIKRNHWLNQIFNLNFVLIYRNK